MRVFASANAWAPSPQPSPRGGEGVGGADSTSERGCDFMSRKQKHHQRHTRNVSRSWCNRHEPLLASVLVVIVVALRLDRLDLLHQLGDLGFELRDPALAAAGLDPAVFPWQPPSLTTLPSLRASWRNQSPGHTSPSSPRRASSSSAQTRSPARTSLPSPCRKPSSSPRIRSLRRASLRSPCRVSPSASRIRSRRRTSLPAPCRASRRTASIFFANSEPSPNFSSSSLPSFSPSFSICFSNSEPSPNLASSSFSSLDRSTSRSIFDPAFLALVCLVLVLGFGFLLAFGPCGLDLSLDGLNPGLGGFGPAPWHARAPLSS